MTTVQQLSLTRWIRTYSVKLVQTTLKCDDINGIGIVFQDNLIVKKSSSGLKGSMYFFPRKKILKQLSNVIFFFKNPENNKLVIDKH